MLLRHNLRSKPVFFVSQVTLLLFFLIQLPERLYPQFHPELMDGVRGFLLGVAIATMAMTLRLRRRGV